MKEIQTILKEVGRLKADGSAAAVLATVVDVQGSSYRLPGAKMLVGEDGRTFGTVSGGCLEADVLERAKRVLQTGAAHVITYDTRGREDSVFSLNMGCNGVVRILLERIDGASPLLKTWEIVFANREKQVTATLVSAAPPDAVPIGGRVFYSETEQFDFKNLPNFLESLSELRDDCVRLLREDRVSRTSTYQTARGGFEFFFEIIKPPTALFIFGAGYDAVPLADFAQRLGWRVTVIDHRAAFAVPERFPTADEILISPPENATEKLTIDDGSAAVLMTHNYAHDKEILRRLLGYDSVRYVGALGPKRRTENILRELGEEGKPFPAENLGKLHAPVGLDIGAETPEAIAVAIVAEIQSVLANRAGGFLRERQGSIYRREPN